MSVVTPPVPGEHPLPAQCASTLPGVEAILRRGAQSGRLTHLEHIPARAGQAGRWPDWVPAGLAEAFGRAGVTVPWVHQADAACHAWDGRNVIISTGTASGKSLGYLLPALAGVMAGGTALYIAPTRALAADQVRMIRSLELRGVRPTVIDGDTPYNERAWARAHANYLLTTPDMLHHTLLPQHSRWNGFLRRLQYVIVDECHGYRGVFGSHVAQVLRRLRRVAAYHAMAGQRAGRGRLATAPPRGILAAATVPAVTVPAARSGAAPPAAGPAH